MNQLSNQPHKVSFSMQINKPSWQHMINMTLGDPKKAQRFTTAIVSAVNTNPALQECDHKSIVSGALLGESLNLSPSPVIGQYYLVPFNDKKAGCKKAQFVISYKGLIQLAIRSGIYTRLNADVIKEGELISWNPITEDLQINPDLDPIKRENAKTSHYFATFTTTSGFTKTIVWSAEKMMAHADRYSPAFKADDYKKLIEGKIPKKDEWKYSSFWYKDFDAMAIKTMLRQLLNKWGQLSIEMSDALQKDENIITAHEGGVFEAEEPDYSEPEPVPVEVVEEEEAPEEIDLTAFED